MTFVTYMITKRICLLNQKVLKTSNKYKYHNRKLEDEISKHFTKGRVNCPYLKNCSALLGKKYINFNNNDAYYQDPSYAYSNYDNMVVV